ncbi:MAG: HIT family protein [Steroidobacteraceae bacterium]
MAYDHDNIFAKILRGEIPAHKVYEDESTLAFMDVMPQSDGHTLVVPKVAAENIFELSADQLQLLIVVTQQVAQAARQAFNADGLTLMQFNGEVAGQTVPHIHFHVIPRYAGKVLQVHGRGMADKEVLKRHAEQLRKVLSH